MVREYRAMGIYPRGYVMELVRPALSSDMLRTAEVEVVREGEGVLVAGWPVARQHPRGQDGTVFVTIEDETGDVQLIIWPRVFPRSRKKLGSRVLLVRGVVSRWDGTTNVVVSRVPLPAVAYDACEKQAGRVSSLSLVRYRANDYSAPVAYGHRDVLVKGYVDRVVISCGSEVIARHHRSYQRDDFVFDPVHYLPLLEQKTAALDQAAALQGWDLPEEFATLRRLLESRMGRRGKREFVQVLRLFEHFFAWGGPRRGSGCHPVGGFELRRGEASGALPAGGPAAPPRPGTLSLPAPGAGQHHFRRGLHDIAVGEGGMNSRSTLLLEHHLKELKLLSFFREYGKMAAQCAAEGVDHPGYLLRLAELELIDRHQRMVERRIRSACFPAVKTFDDLRLYGHPVGEQGAGDGVGPLRIRPKPGERHRRRQQRHRQDPRGPGTGPGRLPERHVRGLHHRRRPGPRVDGGPG